MAEVNKYFQQFHDNIKMENENNILKSKRDIILEKLKKNISEDAAHYDTFNQGSYAMSTGVKPIDGDYDIDVGIKFKISKEDFEPIKVKEWVLDALENHTTSVRMKTPCVTVTYQQNNEPIYHVDLAVYSIDNDDDECYIAKGKLESLPENKKWEISNPAELIKIIRERYDDCDDRAQFRRIIRYLKRWKDIKFTQGGNSKPTGIALTCGAYHWLKPNKILIDPTANNYKYCDLECLIDLVAMMKESFTYVWNNNESQLRLSVELPVEPHCDLYEKMTSRQMEDFKVRLEKLLEVLADVKQEVDPVEACKKLRKEFGDDFPVPSPEETAKVKSVAITTTSSSAN